MDPGSQGSGGGAGQQPDAENVAPTPSSFGLPASGKDSQGTTQGLPDSQAPAGGAFASQELLATPVAVRRAAPAPSSDLPMPASSPGLGSGRPFLGSGGLPFPAAGRICSCGWGGGCPDGRD